ncbi:MAG: ABC-2 family transporter protein, partial [Candidatus Andersenbacteria bacterium]|nr:ABC-2 family transporter protein [Candidatus Andersenbacteria bacterium]
KLWRVLALDFSRTLQYRTDALLWMLAEAAIPLVAMFIWLAVSAGSNKGPTGQEILSYYVVVIFVKLLTDAWNGAFMAQDILQGEIVQDLVRPIPVVFKYIANNLTEKVIKLILPIAAIIFIALLKPDFFSNALLLPHRWLLFVISLALAMTLQFLIDMVIGTLAFWLEDVNQLRQYKEMLSSAASGLLIPLAFLPSVFVTGLNWLPFRYVISAPAEILTGNYVSLTAPSLITIQAAWVFALVLIIRWQWRAGLRRYAIPGQ